MYKYTKEDCIIAIQDFYKENNRIPTQNEFKKTSKYPHCDTVRRLFNSWNNAIIASGFEVNKKIGYTKKDCINAIQDFYIKNQRAPKARDFNNINDYPGHNTVRRLFGSWNAAIEEAGLSINRKSFYTKEECIKAIQNFYDENSRLPISTDFENNKNYPSDSAVRNLFGSWNKGLSEAGFTIFNHTKESCIESIKNFYNENKRIPLANDFRENLKYPNVKTVQKLCGSWNNAIEEAGFIPVYSNQFGNRIKAKDGVLYRSWYETYFVDNYLFEKEKYFYEVKYPEPHNKYYDFYLPEKDLYIEIDGGLRPQVIQEKIKINKELNRNLLVISTNKIIKFRGFNVERQT